MIRLVDRKFNEVNVLKNLYVVFNWVCGLLFLMVSLMAFINSNFLAGLILLVASLFLIPAARDFAYKKTSKEISPVRRGLIVSVLFIGFGITVGGQGKNISVSENGKTGSLAAAAVASKAAEDAANKAARALEKAAKKADPRNWFR